MFKCPWALQDRRNPAMNSKGKCPLITVFRVKGSRKACRFPVLKISWGFVQDVGQATTVEQENVKAWEGQGKTKNQNSQGKLIENSKNKHLTEELVGYKRKQVPAILQEIHLKKNNSYLKKNDFIYAGVWKSLIDTKFRQKEIF